MATDGEEAIRVEEAEPVDREDAAESFASETNLHPQEALERLRSGETLRDLRIVGLRLKGEFSLPVQMERVELVTPKFDKAHFLDEVALNRCKIIQPKFGHGATFDRGFDLRGSTVINAQFARVTVKGPWRCDNLRAIGSFVVVNSRFEDTVRFWDARFEGWADFKGCTIVGEADFRSFHAEEGFKLLDCRFEGDALFRGATTCKKWDGGTSRFEKLLDLSKVKFHDFVYLEGIQTGPEHRIAFYNAVVDRVLIRVDQVEGRLLSEETGQHEQAMHEYGLLKKVFEGLHRYEQEDWAFYRFKVNQRRSRPRSWNRPWSKISQLMDWLFLDLGCGYGTNPFRAVRMSGLLMLAFGLIYMLDVSALPVEKLPFNQLAETHPLNRVMIGVLTSVSVFTSGFGSLRDAAQGWMNIPLIVESLLGTLLWGLFIVAFSRKVIR